MAGRTEAEALQGLLLEPEVCKAISKLAWADEWAQSLQQSHPDTEQRRASVDTFWREVELLQQAFSQSLPRGMPATELLKSIRMSDRTTHPVAAPF